MTATTAGSGVAHAHGDGLSDKTPTASATLFGLIDLSSVHANHANTKRSDFNAPRVAWLSGKRWGLTGRRAMGASGMNVIFRLQSEFESQTGNMDTAGTLFNRDAWVGVENASLGKPTPGRQNAIAPDPASCAIYGGPYGPAAPSTEEGGYTDTVGGVRLHAGVFRYR